MIASGNQASAQSETLMLEEVIVTVLLSEPLTLNLGYGYQDEFYASNNESSAVLHDGYGLWGASFNLADIRLGDLDGSFRVLLWGKNLADEEYTVVGGKAFGSLGAEEVLTFGDRRSYGLTLSYLYD